MWFRITIISTQDKIGVDMERQAIFYFSRARCSGVNLLQTNENLNQKLAACFSTTASIQTWVKMKTFQNNIAQLPIFSSLNLVNNTIKNC